MNIRRALITTVTAATALAWTGPTWTSPTWTSPTSVEAIYIGPTVVDPDVYIGPTGKPGSEPSSAVEH